MSDHGDLPEAIRYFADFERCKEFLMAVRWPSGPVTCPACGSAKVCYLAKNRVWKCYAAHSKSRFTLKTGTIFEDSPLPLEKWLPAVWAVVNLRDGLSSWELHRQIGVTQRTAWFMKQRVQLAMRHKKFGKADASSSSGKLVWPAFQADMVRLLRVSKAELDRMVQDAKLASPRYGDPFAQGRKPARPTGY